MIDRPETSDTRRAFQSYSVFKEAPDIHKETFVREEVRIRKEVEQTTVEATEQIRREELDINTDVRTNIDKNHNRRK